MGNNDHEQNDNPWALLAGLLATCGNLFPLSRFGDILLQNVALLLGSSKAQNQSMEEQSRIALIQLGCINTSYLIILLRIK